MVDRNLIREIKVLQGRLMKFELLESRDKDATRAMRPAKQQYADLCAKIPGGVVMTTTEGHILDASQAYQDMVSYTLAELKSVTYQQLTPAKWHEAEEKQVARAAEEDYVQFDKEYVAKDGTVIPISVTGWIIKDKQGKSLGTGSIVTKRNV